MQQTAMQLSVIIPCLNAAETIGAQLEALAQQQWQEPWEVIVADNGSTDDSLAIVERYKGRIPNLHVADASGRKGQPYALNVGAMAATGEALAFCDADDEVAPGWLSAMGEALSKHAFVACKIDTEKLNPPWVYAVLGQHEQMKGLQKNWYPPYLHHGGGGTLGVKRSLHQAIGGFDEALPYLHDTDYCFRLQLADVKLHFVPNAVAYLRYRHKLGGIFCQARHWAEYSVKVYKKYRPLTGVEVPQPWKRYVHWWKYLLRQFPRTREKKDYAHHVFMLGWQIGLLLGSIKYRVPPVPF
jgi:glycosyltransferase involved in cell wall biosynthesis